MQEEMIDNGDSVTGRTRNSILFLCVLVDVLGPYSQSSYLIIVLPYSGSLLLGARVFHASPVLHPSESHHKQIPIPPPFLLRHIWSAFCFYVWI